MESRDEGMAWLRIPGDTSLESQSGSGKFRTDNRPVVEFLPGRVRGLADHECSRKQQMDFSVQTFHF